MDSKLNAIVERELGAVPEWISREDEGLLHETYSVRCNGEEYILQFSSNVANDRDDAIERGLHCYLLFQESEVPVPTPVTEHVKEYDGRQYILVEKLPGKTGEQDISPEKPEMQGDI